MEGTTKTRKLLQELSNILEKRNDKSIYSMLSNIINNMAMKYNLKEEEIHKQLEMIIKSLEV